METANVNYSDCWDGEVTVFDRASDLVTHAEIAGDYKRVGEDRWPENDAELLKLFEGEE